MSPFSVCKNRLRNKLEFIRQLAELTELQRYILEDLLRLAIYECSRYTLHMVCSPSVAVTNRQKITQNGPEVYNCLPCYTRRSVRPDHQLSLIHPDEPGRQGNRVRTGTHLASCMVASQASLCVLSPGSTKIASLLFSCVAELYNAWRSTSCHLYTRMA
jgi:hypothetical protein